MRLSTVINRIPGWYAAGKCIYLKSAPGRGKTSVLASAPEILSRSTGRNIGLVIINGPLLTPADSIGYLVPKAVVSKDIDGNEIKHMESVYTDPFWFRTKEGKRLDEYDGGIIVVDEADKMDVDVKKVIGEAALTGRLGPHQLPNGWIIWMAGNRQKDRSGSTKELDHLINRRMEIDITDDIESWNMWADKHMVTPLTKAFANQNPQIVFSDGVPEKQGPWCTPRSLVEADDYLRTITNDGGYVPDDAETMEEVGGMIGEAAAAQLFSFVKLEREMPRFEDIIANPKTVKTPSKPDAAMLVCYNLAHRVNMQTCDDVLTYINRMDKEFGVIFGKAAVARDPKLITTKGFNEWIKNNSSLMAQIGAHSR